MPTPMTKRVITLTEAMAEAPTDVHADRQRWGDALFDRAVEHHTSRNLRANIGNGTTRDKDGIQSRFVAYDWACHYESSPDHVYYDFFKGIVCNSCSRMERGLNP